MHYCQDMEYFPCDQYYRIAQVVEERFHIRSTGTLFGRKEVEDESLFLDFNLAMPKRNIKF